MYLWKEQSFRLPFVGKSLVFGRKEKEMKNLKRGRGELGCSEKGRQILQWNPNVKTRI
jgi:hypothetical protein